jgi:CubicO group peptidase (beta-lactamase class C family)
MKRRSKYPLIAASLAFLLINAVSMAADSVRVNDDVVTAQTDFARSFDRFMETLNKELNIETGTAIAVVQNDKILYQNNFGYADIKAKQKVTGDSLFYLASITKPLFALTILQELENRALTLDSPLQTLFPEITFAKDTQADKVTIKQLLVHTSGLDNNGLSTALAISGEYNHSSLLGLLNETSANPQNPLTHFSYTNLGYNILSMAFEQHFGHSWQASLQDKVLTPMSMLHTTPFITEDPEQKFNRAKPYSFFNTSINTPLYLQKNNQTMHAAGGVISNTEDMAKLLIVELNQGRLDGKQVLPEGLIKRSQQIAAIVDTKKGDFKRTGYALGWYTGDYKSQLLYHHFGRFDGYRPHLSFMPEKKLGLVILNNEGDLNDKVSDIIADFAYSTLLGEADIDIRINQRIAKMREMATVIREKIIAKETSYEVMPLQLTLAETSYSGDYCHKLMGCLSITLKGEGQFTYQWGNLHSNATASGKIDALRVKGLPTHPQVIAFNIAEGNVESLNYDRFKFNKKMAKL